MCLEQRISSFPFEGKEFTCMHFKGMKESTEIQGKESSLPLPPTTLYIIASLSSLTMHKKEPTYCRVVHTRICVNYFYIFHVLIASLSSISH